MKRKECGFTMVELLTTITIIAMLTALLIPALTMVRRIAKETQQKAQFLTIDLALTAFRNDYGDYPPSEIQANNYCGAQKLAEALLGRDLLGFHPKSNWDATSNTYYTTNPTDDDLEERMGQYLDVTTSNAFKLGKSSGEDDGLYDNTGALARDTFVICDIFNVVTVKIGEQRFRAGTPILYFKANTASKKMEGGSPLDMQESIYNIYDNYFLLNLAPLVDEDETHPLRADMDGIFYDDTDYSYKIIDPRASEASGRAWPYRPDSYILISAGLDGLYGTKDDILNTSK